VKDAILRLWRTRRVTVIISGVMVAALVAVAVVALAAGAGIRVG